MRDLLERYLRLLLETNAHTNLTAIRDPEEIRTRHFEDSLHILNAASFKNKRVIDVGSGAGFPGLVLRIAEPSVKLTLLDASGKKVRFMRSVCGELGLDGVLCVHGRAEELAHDPAYREKYDIATARGVAALPALCEICLPFVRQGGVLLALKGSAEAFAGAGDFGGSPLQPFAYRLSDGRTHTVCRFKKTSPTPKRFPRSWSAIKK